MPTLSLAGAGSAKRTPMMLMVLNIDIDIDIDIIKYLYSSTEKPNVVTKRGHSWLISSFSFWFLAHLDCHVTTQLSRLPGSPPNPKAKPRTPTMDIKNTYNVQGT